MDLNLFAEALSALHHMLDPARMLFVAAGVLIGLALGIIPGLGGLVGLSLLLPFTYGMDPQTALGFLVGLSAVVATGDTIPAVLFGVPGTVGSAATVMDGYPLARKGEAGRALSAAFPSSLIGGLFGALLLGLTIPILRPVMLHFGSSELLAFCIFGLSLVAVLSAGSAMKGLIAVSVGLMIATVGDDPQTGTLRWTLGSLYLWDGIPIVPFALGLFALPELADLAIGRRAIVAEGAVDTRAGRWQGVRDTFRNIFLVFRCSIIGSGLGAVPGIGGAVIDWIAYGHAAATEKGARESFGKGDIRGVIASESSNNAKEGGALVPTIAFGVPGSASMAVLLGAFLIQGLVPGPEMVTRRLDITYALVWTIAIANILGAGLCFLLSAQLAKIAQIRVGILAPLVIAIVFIGAYQGSKDWGDLYVLLGVGLLGWFMKRLDWPRPPLMLGFVLGPLLERYMFISVNRYGFDWMLRPIVLVLLGLTLIGIARAIIANSRAPRGDRKTGLVPHDADRFNLITGGTAAVFFALALYFATPWPFGARLVPYAVGLFGLLMCALFLVPVVLRRGRTAAAGDGASVFQRDLEPLSAGEIGRRGGIFFAWCLFYLAAAWVVGLLPAMVLFLTAYLLLHAREARGTTALLVAGAALAGYLIFQQFLHIPWPASLLGDAFPGLRQAVPLF